MVKRVKMLASTERLCRPLTLIVANMFINTMDTKSDAKSRSHIETVYFTETGVHRTFASLSTSFQKVTTSYVLSESVHIVIVQSILPK